MFVHMFKERYWFPPNWANLLYLRLRALERAGLMESSGRGLLFFRPITRPTARKAKKKYPRKKRERIITPPSTPMISPTPQKAEQPQQGLVPLGSEIESCLEIFRQERPYLESLEGQLNSALSLAQDLIVALKENASLARIEERLQTLLYGEEELIQHGASSSLAGVLEDLQLNTNATLPSGPISELLSMGSGMQSVETQHIMATLSYTLATMMAITQNQSTQLAQKAEQIEQLTNLNEQLEQAQATLEQASHQENASVIDELESKLQSMETRMENDKCVHDQIYQALLKQKELAEQEHLAESERMSMEIDELSSERDHLQQDLTRQQHTMEQIRSAAKIIYEAVN